MKTARFAIFLTGLIGLGMGGLISITNIQSQQEEANLRNHDFLKTQAQGLVDQFFTIIETVRSGGNPNYVLNQFSVKLSQGIPSEIESSRNDAVKNDSKTNPGLNQVISNSPQTIDLALEDRLLNALKNQVNLSDLQMANYSIGTYEMSEIGNKEGIFVAIPSLIDPKFGIQKISVILVDPNLAMSNLVNYGNPEIERNAYLISKTGKVLAHTSNAYIGTDLRKAEGLKPTLENLFLGPQAGTIGNYRNISGTQEQVALLKTGSLPFAIGVEQRSVPAGFSLAWFEEKWESGAAKKGLGLLMIVIAASMALFSVVTFAFNRSIQKEVKVFKFENRNNQRETHEIKHDRAEKEIRTPRAPAKPKDIPIIDEEIQRAAEILNQNQNQMAQEVQIKAEARSAISGKITVHRDYAEELVSIVKNCTQAEEIEKTLAKLSSELSESPTLFLRYNRRMQNLTLATVAGTVDLQNRNLYQVYVRKDIEEQIESFAKEGKVASLSNYGPISKMMITNLNIAHFEAWAVTSEAAVSGNPKLVGLLIILNAGFRSAQSRPVLSRMLKESGNYLFAISNKISNRIPTLRPDRPNAAELNS